MNELDLFTAAIAIKVAADRNVLLDRECAGNPELRQRLERLVGAHFEANLLLDQQAVVTVDRGRSALVGEMIAGRYKLLEEIGEGGMGTVWVAEQTEPVRRKVALKLIKAGMDSRSVLARFEAERQALAVMDHPNIAKVLDGGIAGEPGASATGGGRPYFVMEYVKGVPITEYCDATRLSVPQRLNLFVQVCQAVQHAHQKGIIHRDLKPSNILVAPYDDLPVPKVIDFGLAKAMHQSLTEKTLHTAHETVLGTPLYMSPEQAQLNNIDVDTRSDIYSLGVLLYELLTGTTPLEKQRFKEAAWDEVKRIIREEEPPRPSTRISSAVTLPSLAAGRQIEPTKLTRLVRGELDWIVMKSLEKDRSRRYETANGFAADVQRYLDGEPVLAAPPSTAYRFKKFVRRNRPQVIAVSLVLLALVAGIIGTTLGLIEARRQAGIARTEATAKEKARAAEAEQRQAAERAAATAAAAVAAEKAAMEQTQKRLAQIEKGVDLFAGLLAGINPRAEEKDGKPLFEQLRERAEKAADELQAEAVGDPQAEARLQTTLGETLQELGAYAKAVEVLERARATRERVLGADHPDTRATLNSLAAAYLSAGRATDVIPLLERLRDAELKEPGADNAVTIINLAAAYADVGRTVEAIPLLERVRDDAVKNLGDDHAETLKTLNNLAEVYMAAGRTAEAIALHERVRDARVKKLGGDHPVTLLTLSNLARAYGAYGRTADAIALYEQVRDAQVKKLGVDHPHTLVTLGSLAGTYEADGRMTEAIAQLERVRDAQVKKLGVDHPHTLTTLGNLAGAYRADGRTAEAIPLLEHVHDAKVKKLGADHPSAIVTHCDLAAAYWSLKRLGQSIPMFEDALARQEKKQGRQHPTTLTTVANLGVNYRDAGRLAEAIPLLEEAYRAAKTHPRLRWVGLELLKAYQKSGKSTEAVRLRDELLADSRTQLPKDSPQLARQLAQVGLLLLESQGFNEAEPLLRECLAIREKKEHGVWTTFNTQSMLGGALLGQKKYADAEPLLLAGYEGIKQREKAIPAQSKIRLPEALDRLIEIYTATDKLDEVKKWQAERAKYPQPAAPQETK